MRKILKLLDNIDLSFFEDMWKDIVAGFPKIIAVLVLLIIGWIVVKIVTKILKKVLNTPRVDKIEEKIKEVDLFRNIGFDLSDALIKVIRWVLILFITISASEILGIKMLSEGLAAVIAYLPKLFTAIIIFMVGVFLANVVKNGIISAFKAINLSGGNVIGNIVFLAITIMISITALNQASVDTEIITNNLTLIFGSLLLVFTIAFGLGSRDIIERLLFGFYSRKNLSAGMKIKIGDKEGVVESVDNISLILRTVDKKLIIPIKEVNDSVVEIKD